MCFDVNPSTLTITIYDDGGMLHLRGPIGTTWQQAVNALNAWATVHLDAGVSPIASLTSPGDGSVPVTEVVTDIFMLGDLGGNPRSLIKYSKDGETITIPIGGVAVPVYTSSDPIPPLPIWFRYEPPVQATSIMGSGQVAE
jgi:hypothetical protein